jgi:intraflagellar transport protein 172
VFLLDEKGEMHDKFKAKGNSDAPGGADHPFVVQDMAYSPESARLALAQSDHIVFVYKLGLDWKDKKAISNKFPTQVINLPRSHAYVLAR